MKEKEIIVMLKSGTQFDLNGFEIEHLKDGSLAIYDINGSLKLCIAPGTWAFAQTTLIEE